MVLLVLLLNSYLQSDKVRHQEQDIRFQTMVERLKTENDEKPPLDI